MPIAFKEWAVTVRALAEGEQLLTLRKGVLPQAGKPWNQEGCDLQTEMQTGLVYYWKNGAVAEESDALLKAWMVKHKFDPENGSEEPAMAARDSTEESDPLLEAPE